MNKIAEKCDKEEIKKVLKEIPDIYSDFYITKNNLRLSIKENFNVVFNDVLNGDLMFYNERAVVLINGLSEKDVDRKYLKFIYSDVDYFNSLLEFVKLNIAEIKPIFCKIKRDNDWSNLINIGFKPYKNRGKEILLIKE